MSPDVISFLPRFSYLSPKLENQNSLQEGQFGSFTTQPIQPGELLAVWGGVIVNSQQIAELPAIFQEHSIQVEENLYLVSQRPDEPADYINHSCEPNAGLRGQIALVAMRAIQIGEEICFDYAMSDGTPYDEFDCACGSPLCRRQITGNDWQRPELWARYAGYFSPYLQRRIDRLQQAFRPRFEETAVLVKGNSNGNGSRPK